MHWLNTFLYRIDQETRDPVIERISTITEAKTMLQTKIREYEQKLIEQGIEKDKLETAKCLLAMGLSVEDICKATALPEATVLNMKKKAAS